MWMLCGSRRRPAIKVKTAHSVTLQCKAAPPVASSRPSSLPSSACMYVQVSQAGKWSPLNVLNMIQFACCLAQGMQAAGSKDIKEHSTSKETTAGNLEAGSVSSNSPVDFAPQPPAADLRFGQWSDLESDNSAAQLLARQAATGEDMIAGQPMGNEATVAQEGPAEDVAASVESEVPGTPQQCDHPPTVSKALSPRLLAAPPFINHQPSTTSPGAVHQVSAAAGQQKPTKAAFQQPSSLPEAAVQASGSFPRLPELLRLQQESRAASGSLSSQTTLSEKDFPALGEGEAPAGGSTRRKNSKGRSKKKKVNVDELGTSGLALEGGDGAQKAADM